MLQYMEMLQCQTQSKYLRLYLGRAGSMISLQWDFGVHRVTGVLPEITSSNLSTAMVMLQDAAFVCAFAWYVILPGLFFGVSWRRD